MNFTEYQHLAARTASEKQRTNPEVGINAAALGLCGEAGEVADLVKKVQHHEIGWNQERLDKLHKELGDVLWYLALACTAMGWSLDDVAEVNIAKLKKRYPDGFSPEASLAKADEKPETGPAICRCGQRSGQHLIGDPARCVECECRNYFWNGK